MAATINTNIASINAQRNLSFSGQSLNTTMQRLSSGLRVNSAKDDAAGLAIAERMNTQVRGLTVASRNANDGISLAQTAEGALGRVGDILQRMRELAVQAGNATNSSSDREAIQLEVKQLYDEVDRVAKQSNFNGQKILDGSFAGAVFQVGANSGDNITVGTLVDTRSAKISNVSYGEANLLFPDDSIDTNLADSPITDYDKPVPENPDDDDPLTITYTLTDEEGNENEYSVPLAKIGPASSPAERLGQVVEAINNVTSDTGVTAYLSKIDGTDHYEVFIVSGRIGGDGKPASIAFENFDEAFTGIGDISIDDELDEEEIGIGTGFVMEHVGINSVDVSTQKGAWVALRKIDSAINQVNAARATLGAVQTRFETAVNNIDIQVENLSAARGRIVDADFAKETANLSRTQILQQAGTAMVAQANQLPQQVLQLLQG